MTAAGGSALALLGGPRSLPASQRVPRWPVVTPEVERAVRRVLASGRFTSLSAGDRECSSLESEWAATVGARHCVAVGSGTAALTLCLAALDMPPGSEVIVPAFGFVACALAPMALGAVPVFVDVDPDTYDLDPAAVEATIGPRTAAIMPVHLHGLPADMDALMEIARRRGLAVVEDAAQAHGASYRGRAAGTIGDAGAFSLNASKNLPTCGEGGLITTDDEALARACRAMRQFGEEVEQGTPRPYLSERFGWNYKISSVQAAFTRSQLATFAAYGEQRERNVRAFLLRLADLPGLVVPLPPPDRDHAWHILRLRVDPTPLGLERIAAGPLRAVLFRALRAEGVPLSDYQLVPLPAQPLFGTRHGGLEGALREFPHTTAAIEETFTIQRAHLHPDAGEVLQLYAGAFEKVWEHIPALARLAGTDPYEPPWGRAMATAP